MKLSHLSILHLMVIQNWKFSTKIEKKKKKKKCFNDSRLSGLN